MVIRIAVLLMVYAAMAYADLPRLKRLERREIAAYSAMVLVTIYLAVDYAAELNFPFIHNAADYLLNKPASWIVEALKKSS